MKYLSVCSGIEAATQAWHPLGWTPVAFSEIEAFPSAVLAHHYPNVPNWGDMTKFKEWPDADVDVLCGGTPCQSFSVAGLRQGLADPRGNLMLTYLAIAARYRPRWLVWENVPGVLSSSGGRDFGSFLGAMGELGYGFAYRVLDAQHVRTRRFPHAVPQRRRRVFVVGYLGDYRRAGSVLFDRESLSGHPAPRRQAGQGTTHDVAGSLVSSGRGVERAGDTRGQDPVFAVPGLIASSGDVFAAHTVGALRTRQPGAGGQGSDAEQVVAHTLAARSGSALCAPDIQTFLPVPLTIADGFDVCGTLSDGAHNGGGLNGQDAYTGRILPVAWSIMPQNSGKDYKARQVDVSQPLMAAGPGSGNQGGDLVQQSVAFDLNQITSPANRSQPDPAVHHTLPATSCPPHLAMPWAVRRLTPVECERLQGFPDDFTRIPYRGKPAEQCPDGPRYKALGNSWAVNCAEWIGERINEVEQMP